MSDDLDIRIAKLTKRQAEGLRFACSARFAPGVGHTASEFWNEGRGVGSSVLSALVRKELVEALGTAPLMWRATPLGYRVAERLADAAPE